MESNMITSVAMAEDGRICVQPEEGARLLLPPDVAKTIYNLYDRQRVKEILQNNEGVRSYAFSKEELEAAITDFITVRDTIASNIQEEILIEQVLLISNSRDLDEAQNQVDVLTEENDKLAELLEERNKTIETLSEMLMGIEEEESEE